MRNLLVTISCLLLYFSVAYGRNSEEYEFVRDYIESLKNVNAAAETETAAKNCNTSALISGLTKANKKITLAKDFIRRYQDSKNADIKFATDYILKSYDIQIAANKKSIEFYEALNNPEAIANPSKFDQKNTTAEIDDIAVEKARSWKTLSDCTSMIFLSVLVNPSPSEGKKTNYLTITRKERDWLIEQIDKIFGNEVKNGPQKNRAVPYNCAALIRMGLAKPYRASDERAGR